ncbi:hypothetical protein, partial [Sporisorium scitamineum]
ATDAFPATPAPPVAPSALPAPSLPLPRSVATTDFVTRTVAASVGELCQLLQDDLFHAIQGLTAAFQASQPAAPSSAPPAPTLVVPPPPSRAAISAQLGEYQTGCRFPWVPSELVDKVHNDTIGVYELPKLANPSWTGGATEGEPTELTIDGFRVVKAPSASSTNKQFLKAIPNFDAFTRVWVVYSSLRTASSPDRDLPIGLGRFYLHIAETQATFPWNRVVDYIITLCTQRLGKASAAEWARFDGEINNAHFQGLVAKPTNSSNKRPRNDDPRRSEVCHSWNNGKRTGTDQRPCVRKHVCNHCNGSHMGKTCPRQPAVPAPAKVSKQG